MRNLLFTDESTDSGLPYALKPSIMYCVLERYHFIMDGFSGDMLGEARRKGIGICLAV